MNSISYLILFVTKFDGGLCVLMGNCAKFVPRRVSLQPSSYLNDEEKDGSLFSLFINFPNSASLDNNSD